MGVLRGAVKQDSVQIISHVVTAWLLNALLSYKQTEIIEHVLPNHSPSPLGYARGLAGSNSFFLPAHPPLDGRG